MADEFKNIKISVEDRANTQLSGSTTLKFAGIELDTDDLTEWVEVDVLGESPRATRAGERFEFWTVQANCYAVTGPGGETTHRVWEFADLMRAAFHQYTLAVKDWSQAAPEPTLFYLRFAEAQVTPIAPPAEAGKWLQQVNVSFEAHAIT